MARARVIDRRLCRNCSEGTGEKSWAKRKS